MAGLPLSRSQVRYFMDHMHTRLVSNVQCLFECSANLAKIWRVSLIYRQAHTSSRKQTPRTATPFPRSSILCHSVLSLKLGSLWPLLAFLNLYTALNQPLAVGLLRERGPDSRRHRQACPRRTSRLCRRDNKGAALFYPVRLIQRRREGVKGPCVCVGPTEKFHVCCTIAYS